MDVSIVIVSFNTCNLLDECIASIERETQCGHEVIVVDNASTDGSPQMLREKYQAVTLIENEENVGFARANNQGFSGASGKYFVMLNPDTVILDRAIDKLVEFMERNLGVGICGPCNVGRERQLQYNCDHFPSFWNTLWVYTNLVNRYPNIKIFRKSRMLYWDYATQRDVDRITGCSLMIRAEVFRDLDGLDNNYFMYFEETDLCFRARKNGKRVVYLPHAVIIHYGGESSQSQTGEVTVGGTVASYFLNSQYYFFQKNCGRIPMLAMRALDLCYGSALLLRNSIRIDKAKMELGRIKGRALVMNAIRFR
jgi:GT2 family glycosyltransferase